MKKILPRCGGGTRPKWYCVDRSGALYSGLNIDFSATYVCALEAGGVTATYDMFVENSKAHIMKRSGMDVDVTSTQQTLPLYSVRLQNVGLIYLSSSSSFLLEFEFRPVLIYLQTVV